MAQANSAIINSTLPISTKYTKIVGKWIKKRSVDQAINLLERVVLKEVAVPCVVHNKNIAHKRGTGPGKYPRNVAVSVIKMLKEVKANAKAKGLDETKLIISEFIPNMAVSKEHRGKYKTGALTHLKIGVVVKE